METAAWENFGRNTIPVVLTWEKVGRTSDSSRLIGLESILCYFKTLFNLTVQANDLLIRFWGPYMGLTPSLKIF